MGAIVDDLVAAASLFRTVTRQLSVDQGKHVAGFGHDVNVPDDRGIGEIADSICRTRRYCRDSASFILPMGCSNSRRPPASHDPLPYRFLACLAIVADLFTRPTWSKVPMLLAGVSLAPGRRAVTSALRVWGENTILTSPPSTASSAEPALVVLHDGGPMLVLLVAAFVPARTPIVIRNGDAIEQRREPKISTRGICRDPPAEQILDARCRAHSIWVRRTIRDVASPAFVRHPAAGPFIVFGCARKRAYVRTGPLNIDAVSPQSLAVAA